jgi:hypothetical protein
MKIYFPVETVLTKALCFIFKANLETVESIHDAEVVMATEYRVLYEIYCENKIFVHIVARDLQTELAKRQPGNFIVFDGTSELPAYAKLIQQIQTMLTQPKPYGV